MADFNWSEFGSQALGAIASGLGSGSDDTVSPAPAPQAAAFDISSSLPLILIVSGVALVAVLALRK